MTKPNYGVVLVTAPSRDEAAAIARSLVEAKLAACVNIFPIHSIYTWEEELCTDDEWQLIIKTDLAKFDALEAKVRELHSYEVPEAIALPIVSGSAPYLHWMNQRVNS
ncbi:MAG: divalent-cation tolerance protein CutA [Cyanobacteriota bacterium]|nr:divalent-cation tolerance protein CutA [Cyanobacteriota bacterium]